MSSKQAKHTPDAQNLFIGWFDDLDVNAYVDSPETRNRDIAECGFMAGRQSVIPVRDDLLAALESAELSCAQTRLANSIGKKTKQRQIDFLLSQFEQLAGECRAAIAKAKGES